MNDQLWDYTESFGDVVRTAIRINQIARRKVAHVVGSRSHGRWRYSLCRCCSYGYGRRVC